MTIEEAQRRHDDEVEYQRARLEEVQEDLARALAAPLADTVTEQVEVKPGEPGYEEAPYAISANEFHGRWDFVSGKLTAIPRMDSSPPLKSAPDPNHKPQTKPNQNENPPIHRP